jgi:hypothetical protein
MGGISKCCAVNRGLVAGDSGSHCDFVWWQGTSARDPLQIQVEQALPQSAVSHGLGTLSGGRFRRAVK